MRLIGFYRRPDFHRTRVTVPYLGTHRMSSIFFTSENEPARNFSKYIPELTIVPASFLAFQAIECVPALCS